jgi:acetylornithine deacetylase/succinyl-diaminopimelate desuccinylase-like protein
MPAPEPVIDALDERYEESIEALCALARIPSVSAPGYDPSAVRRCADETARLLEAAGLERVEVVTSGDAHPYVIAEWLSAPGAPTLLLYAHHDVQPPGRDERWLTPPFEPTLRDDGRLYGRGVVDDKAGIVVFAAAIRAWLEATGSLPLNVKLVVEGEEEIGSDHLADFLRQYRERLSADAIVLSDTANLEAGLPSITTSLRGLVNVDVRLRALDHPLHSGMWGGPVQDAALALSKLLARLTDERGEIAVPGLDADVPTLSSAERDALAALPFDEAGFRCDAGLLEGTRLGGDPERSVYERLWRRPAVAVVALEAMPIATAANQLVAEAKARVGLRLAPGQDPQRAADVLCDFLRGEPPLGCEIETRVESLAGGWLTRPEGPAFEGAVRALARGYGRDPVFIGCGGSIPFVEPFAQVLGGVPALLLGLEDPVCNAHGENESLHTGDFRRAMRAAAHLLAELREIPRAEV